MSARDSTIAAISDAEAVFRELGVALKRFDALPAALAAEVSAALDARIQAAKELIPADQRALHRILPLIVRRLGHGPFLAREVFEGATKGDELSALLLAFELDTTRLGNLLNRGLGVNIGGYRVTTLGIDKHRKVLRYRVVLRGFNPADPNSG